MPSAHPTDFSDFTPERPLRLLLVGNNRVEREHLARLLANAGARVTETTSLRQATDIMQAQAPLDVLVTDLALQDGTGFEVARAAKGRTQHVVLINDTLANVPILEAQAAGVEVLLQKAVLTASRVRVMLEELYSPP